MALCVCIGVCTLYGRVYGRMCMCVYVPLYLIMFGHLA